MDKQKFAQACVLAAARERGGIGTLSEKGLHSALKHYYEPDESCHEVALGGYIADIVGENGVIEIQSANFYSISEKLRHFLSVTCVTLVYPCVTSRRIIRLDDKTGEVVSIRRSPRHACKYDVFHELRGILPLLCDNRLTVIAALLEADEYRRADNKKSGRGSKSSKLELLPTAFTDEIILCSPEDYRAFLPDGLAQSFTSKELASLAGIKPSFAGDFLACALAIGIVERCGKQGRCYLYRVCP